MRLFGLILLSFFSISSMDEQFKLVCSCIKRQSGKINYQFDDFQLSIGEINTLIHDASLSLTKLEIDMLKNRLLYATRVNSAKERYKELNRSIHVFNAKVALFQEETARKLGL